MASIVMPFCKSMVLTHLEYIVLAALSQKNALELEKCVKETKITRGLQLLPSKERLSH